MNEPRPNALSLFASVVGAAAAVIGLLSGAWAFFFDPDGNLFLRLVYAVAALLVIMLGVALYVLTRQIDRASLVAPHQTVQEPMYSAQSRRTVKRVTLLGVPIIAAVVCGLLWIDHRLTPVITDIELMDGRPHEVAIAGERFGVSPRPLDVVFAGERGQILEAAPNLLRVEVPAQFEDGLVTVRRGPRTSASRRLTRNRMRFGVMVAELFDPAEQSPIGELNNQFESYPGFPYFSRASDHPSEWPPRVWQDRGDLFERVKEFFADELVQRRLETIAGALSEESGLSVSTTAPVDPFDDARDIEIRYGRLRLLFNVKTSEDEARQLVGEDVYARYQRLEQYREFLRRSQPNRILVLRLRNTSNGDAENVRIEFDVAGAIYDMTVTGGDGSQSLDAQLSSDHMNIAIPRFLPLQLAEIKVWYRYLSTEERVFPDRKDFLLDATQGISIRNIVVSNGFVEADDSLVTDLDDEAYHAYEIR